MSDIRERLWRRLAAGAGVIPACDKQLMYEAKEELEKQAAEIDRLKSALADSESHNATYQARMRQLQSAYDGLTPQQYHACLSRLWTAIGNPPLDGRDVFTRVADEIVALKAIINAKLYQRKCHDCGHVGWYADSRTPYCLCDRCCSWLCDRCRSWDTRRVKEAQ